MHRLHVFLEKTRIKPEIAASLLLVTSVILALLASNIPFLSYYYNEFLNITLKFKASNFIIDKSITLWINDGLMAIFFLVVALEIKKEALTGTLTSVKKVLLPGIAAVGGMIFPVTIYIFFNANNSAALNGWAIPAATDIAFALGVLTVLGSRVPIQLKVFLLTVAVLDDLGAILIIAIFYSHGISLDYLFYALLVLLTLILLNLLYVQNISVYLLFGVLLWAFILKSGVHATIAGVLIAFTIPRTGLKNKSFNNSVEFVENRLQLWVSFFILPLFAFVNAGISFAGMTFSGLYSTVTIGILLGLALGKPLGIMLVTYLAVKLRFVQLPAGVEFGHIFGVSVLCGIGFTMSLFIGILSFHNTSLIVDTRVGVLLASIISAILGYCILHKVLPVQNANAS